MHILQRCELNPQPQRRATNMIPTKPPCPTTITRTTNNKRICMKANHTLSQCTAVVWCHSKKILRLAAEQQTLKKSIKHYSSALIFMTCFSSVHDSNAWMTQSTYFKSTNLIRLWSVLDFTAFEAIISAYHGYVVIAKMYKFHYNYNSGFLLMHSLMYF